MPSKKTNDKRMELWKEYSATKSPESREKIILEYTHLIKYIAGRLNIYFGSNVEYDDLVSYGVFGLIDAIDKFDINKGVKFETYASLRIRGAIIDSIRDLDWVPRSIRQKHKQLESVYAEIENEKCRSATDSEVAEKLGISLKEYIKLLGEVNLSTLVSLEEYLEQNYETGTGMVTPGRENYPEQQIELTELREVLANSIDSLPEKERMVISFYYHEELTLKEISKIMGVSESRISQLHTKALIRMKGRLGSYREAMSEV